MDIMVMIEKLAGGMLVSIEIFVLTLLFSLPLGMVVAFARMSKVKIISALAKLYISVLRGTPLMLQLMVVYFGPFFIFGMRITSSYRFIAVIIGFVLNYAAYYAEIYRSGIESMPVGQYEAAKVLGYNKVQTFWKIILPQVIKRILPTLTNEAITLVKDTSLATVVALPEMFFEAEKIAAANTTMLPFVIAFIFYYVFNFIVAYVMEFFEKKMSYFA